MGLPLVLALIVGYLCGSIPVGLIVGKFYGIDLRQHGSRRIGATNALRTAGPRMAMWVLFGDVMKAVVPVALAGIWLDATAQVGAALGAVVGHSWPVFSQFRGGRGVGCGLGTVLVMSMPAAVLGLTIFGLILLATRYVSLGSMIGVSGAGALLVLQAALGMAPSVYAVYGILCAALIVVQHRDNIQRLLTGNERRIGKAE